MRRLLGFGLLLTATFSLPARVEAGSWMFQPSYHSSGSPLGGSNPAAAPPTRRWVGGPYYTQPVGDYVQGSWRWTQTTINIRGRVVDQTNRWESWIQAGGQR